MDYKKITKTKRNGVVKEKYKDAEYKSVKKTDAQGNVVTNRYSDITERAAEKANRQAARASNRAARQQTRVTNRAAILQGRQARLNDKARAAGEKFDEYKKEHGLAKGGSLKGKACKCKKK